MPGEQNKFSNLSVLMKKDVKEGLLVYYTFTVGILSEPGPLEEHSGVVFINNNKLHLDCDCGMRYPRDLEFVEVDTLHCSVIGVTSYLCGLEQ